MDLIAVEIPCPDRATAEAIATALIEARLAACAHVGSEITSVYLWRGRIERAAETPLRLKTRAAHFDTLAARVRALHPYEIPAILAWPIVHATADNREWLAAETAVSSDRASG
jgi:periplasmic divalent cation tolerance protein